MGEISGNVSSFGQAVTGAVIEAIGTEYLTYTDEAGNYSLQLPRGIYRLDIRHDSVGSRKVDNARVIANVNKSTNYTMIYETNVVEEVVVMSKFNPTAFEEDERYSVNVVDTMGAEDLARFGGSDIALSVTRLPSVTVQDNKHIFIRGMGGRYITTTLNGSTMPSTDPNKRSVPLDLFPSNIVSQLDVYKTFTADKPGETTGGNLIINTRTFPEESTGKLSVSLGMVSDLTGDDVYSDSNKGDWDYIGWDDGSRRESIIVSAISKTLNTEIDDATMSSDYLSDEVVVELNKIAASELRDNLDLASKKANPNMSINGNYGNVYYLGEDENELGFFVAGNYKNSWSSKTDGINRSYSGGSLNDDFTFEEYSNNIDASALLSVGFNVGSSTYEANTIYSRTTDSKTKVSEGLDGDAVEPSYKYSIEWVEREFVSQQFVGEHLFGEEQNLTADWQFTVSQATRYSPDRRDVKFNQENTDDPYSLEVGNLVRRYDDLTDDNFDFSSNLEYFLMTDNIEHTFSGGVQLIARERLSESASYGFNTNSTDSTINLAPNLLVSDVINDDSITGDPSTGFQFIDKTLASDAYDSTMDLNSLYLSYDAFIDNTYQIIFGTRYEDFEMYTNTFELTGTQAAVQSAIVEDIFLPSLSFNWFYRDDQQLRFAFSKTVSRPDFKEASNATFYDTEFDIRVRGNPNLKVSEIINADARWEMYMSDTESVSVAAFYKDITDAIERVAITASGTVANSRTFENAESAEIFGIEFDGRKDFPLDDALNQNIFVSLNASVIDSEVAIEGEETRKLQGQPEYTFNLIIGWDDIQSDQSMTLLFNQSGESIKDVGISGNPDVIEEPRMDLNLNYSKMFDNELTLKIKASNLLNSEVEFTQGGQVFQSYKKGVQLEAGIDWNF
jgi:TonB-dependent receptor